MIAHGTILVVDDDTAHLTMLHTLLTSWGYTVVDATDGDVAITAVKEQGYDLVLMDIRMVRMSGLEALSGIKAINPSIPVIIMTAYSSVTSAVEAMKKGAYHYLTKPLDFDELRLVLERGMEHRMLREENVRLKESLGQNFDRSAIIGSGHSMTRLLERVMQVAPAQATVLISGESGTGKELIAGAIHFNSGRKNGPFLRINCAALTETLLEAELFGHEKGAFTGADKRKEGKFVQADGGSIFLDEVSEMSQGMQVKLLRVLQEREVIRVGGSETVPFDVRVIAATNTDLSVAIAAGRFREDLFYRLNVINLSVPPLRERREDIPLLAHHFLAEFASRNGKDLSGFTPAVMHQLVHHTWPGNVRELMNVIERAVVLSHHDYIDTVDLPATEREATIDTALNLGNISLEEVEKATIRETLKTTAGNKSEAARRLGITRRTLHLKLKKYDISDK